MMNSKNKSLLAPLLLIIIGLVLIFIFFLVKFILPTDQKQNNEITDYTPSALSRITQNEAKLAYDQNLAVFLDLRDTTSFDSSHISNAINIPIQFLENRMGELDKAQWIITVCT